MKKLFVSQPMNGKSDKEILDERNRLIAEAEERSGEKFEVLETFFRGAPADAKPLWYLGESLKYLSEADMAIFAQDWMRPAAARSNTRPHCGTALQRW